MIEKVLIDYLKEKLPDVECGYEKPSPIPDKFILLQKTGSERVNFVNKAMFALQSYAESNYEAAVLNDRVKTAMDQLIELDEISSSKLNSDYSYNDTANRRYRYQAVYEIAFL